MFVQYYTHVRLPLSTVETRIHELGDHLEDWADTAYREGEDLYAKVGPGVRGFAKTVRLEIEPAEIRQGRVVYPISWTAASAEGLFPRLTADVILTHLGPDRTKLSLEGTYDPPLGALGRAVDRAMLKNVAEATVQDWVDRVAAAVSSAHSVS